MKTTFSLFAAALVLGACASGPATDSAAATATDKPTQMAGESSLNGPVATGSRLNRGSERAVRVIGSQSYKDDNDVRSIGNEIGLRSR